MSANSCPGSRAVREPVPEYINCPSCGEEVEVWTHELSYPCHKCGTRVFREQRPSCVDWCPHAEECVGPEIYQKLKLEVDAAETEVTAPLDMIRRQHEQALEHLNLLRAATLCLRLGDLAPQPAVRDKGIDHLSQVLDFFDKDLRLHFQREEEILFPILEKHMGVEKSPTQLLLGEHNEVWQRYNQLRGKLEELQKEERAAATATEICEIGNNIAHFLQEHIKRENESLLPLAKNLLDKGELAELAERWQKLGRSE